jgi:hypothetical protein
MPLQPAAAWSFPLIPFERYIWEGSGTSAEIAQRLTAITEPTGLFHPVPGETACDFRGIVSETKFHLRPVLRYRNSFYPVILGRFTPTPRGTQLTVHLRLAWPTVVFLVLWCAIVMRFFVAIREQAAAGAASPFHMLIPAGMLLFVMVITVAAFKQEARHVRVKLREAIETPAA